MSQPGVSYAFARRPKWIVWHIIAALAVVAMVSAGFWQLRRLDQRRTENAIVLARSEQPPQPVQTLLPPNATDADVAPFVFRIVTATGEYQVDDEVIVRNRTNGGAPGYWVLTPIRLEDGRAFVVNRGWIPLLDGDDPDHAAFAPPAGIVTVTGRLHQTQFREGIGIADPAEGTLDVLSRVDVPRLGQQLGYPLLPGYVDLISSDPPGQAIPLPVEPEPLDDGPHLGYAGQWFIFTILTLITYPALLRRTARRQAGVGTSPALDAPAIDDRQDATA